MYVRLVDDWLGPSTEATEVLDADPYRGGVQ
jgi:hypothetical protein